MMSKQQRHDVHDSRGTLLLDKQSDAIVMDLYPQSIIKTKRKTKKNNGQRRRLRKNSNAIDRRLSSIYL